MTVFLTVSFITFLGGVGSLGPITTLKTAVFNAGDFDVMFRRYTDVKPWKIGNTNYYNDEHDFFNAPFLGRSDRVKMSAQNSLQTMIPTVNFTYLDDKARDIQKRSKEQPIELFPRWVASTTLFNPVNRTSYTTAHMIAGDSHLERKIGVAPEFPKLLLQRHEMITSTDVMKILGLQEGETINASVSETKDFILRFSMICSSCYRRIS